MATRSWDYRGWNAVLLIEEDRHEEEIALDRLMGRISSTSEQLVLIIELDGFKSFEGPLPKTVAGIVNEDAKMLSVLNLIEVQPPGVRLWAKIDPSWITKRRLRVSLPSMLESYLAVTVGLCPSSEFEELVKGLRPALPR